MVCSQPKYTLSKALTRRYKSSKSKTVSRSCNFPNLYTKTNRWWKKYIKDDFSSTIIHFYLKIFLLLSKDFYFTEWFTPYCFFWIFFHISASQFQEILFLIPKLPSFLNQHRIFYNEILLNGDLWELPIFRGAVWGSIPTHYNLRMFYPPFNFIISRFKITK